MSTPPPDALAIGCRVIDAGLERIVLPERRRGGDTEVRGPGQSQPLQATGTSWRRCGVRLEQGGWGDVVSTDPIFPAPDLFLTAPLGLKVVVSAAQTAPGDWQAIEWTLESAEITSYVPPEGSDILTVTFDSSDNLVDVSGFGMWPLAGLRYWSGVRPFDDDTFDFLRPLYPRSAEEDAEGNPAQGLGIFIPEPRRIEWPSGTYELQNEALDEGLFPLGVITGTDGPGIVYVRCFNLQPTVAFG